MSDDYRVALESGGDTQAKNPRSTALGSRQFLSSTFLNYVRKGKPAWADGMSDADILAQRTNPDREAEVAGLYDADSRATLQSIGVPESPEALYAMWHFGNGQGGGGAKFLKASDDATTDQIFSKQVLDANPYLKGKTKAEVLANWNGRAGMPKSEPVKATGLAPDAQENPEDFIRYFAPVETHDLPVEKGREFIAPAGTAEPGKVDTAKLEQSQAALEQEQSRKEAQGWTDTFRAAYRSQMTPYFDFFMRANSGIDYKTENPEFQAEILSNAKKYLSGFDSDEQEELLGSANTEDYSLRAARIMEQRENQGVLASASGIGSTTALLSAGLFDPMNIAAGLGAAKIAASAGYSSFQLARAGRAGAAVAANMAENAVGNVAVETAQQALGTHKTASDYFLAAGQGVLFGAVMAPLSIRAGQKALAMDVQRKVVHQQMQDLEQAATELGPMAEVRDVQARAAQIEAARLATLRKEMEAVPASTDKVDAPDLTEMPTEAPAEAVAGTKEQAGADVAPPAENAATGVSEPQSIRLELPDSKTFDATRKLYPYASLARTHGLTSAFPAEGVHLDPKLARMPEFKAVADQAKGMIDKYLPGERVLITGVPEAVKDGGVSVRGAVAQVAEGHVLYVGPETTPTIVVHEVGHMIFNRLAKDLPDDLKVRMQQAVAEWRTKFEQNPQMGMQERMSVINLRNLPESSGLRKLADGTLDMAGFKKMVEDAGHNPEQYLDYFRSVDEFGAEQFVKHIENQAALGKVDESNKVIRKIIRAIKGLLDLFKKAKADGTLAPSTAWQEFFERAAMGEFRPEAKAQGFVDVEAPKFKDWFGESKIVDEDGKPLPLYHGTKHTDDAIGEFRPDDNGLIFASKDTAFAEDYAYLGTSASNERFGPVYQVYAKVDKPFSLSDKAAFDELVAHLGDIDQYAVRALMEARKTVDGFTPEPGPFSGLGDKSVVKGADTWMVLERPSVVQALKELGYDGIWMREGGSDNLAVMSPEQFKSAVGNTGEFSGPEIHKAAIPVNKNAAFDKAHGLDVLPTDTPLARAELKVMRKLIQDAEAWDKANPVDPERVKTIMSKVGMATPGTLLASSSNPLARMLSGTLAEHSMGGNGRRSTVSIRTVQRERNMLGNSLVDYTTAYSAWRDRNGKIAGIGDDMLKMQKRQEFDRLVLEERNERWMGRPGTTDAAIKRAADVLDEVYTKFREAQVNAKTPGWARLPESSIGYTPRITSKGKFLTMTQAQQRGLVKVMAEQFEAFEGFDKEFSEQLARKYLDHARINASGGHEVPMNMTDPSAVEYVRQSMVAMGLTKQQIEAYAKRLAAGAPSHTKARLNMDLNTVIQLEDGSSMKLLDLFETDQLQLLRRQARKVAGEVSLVEQGIMGKQGLRVLRRALDVGQYATAQEKLDVMKAFDQVAAEITGTPFGDQLPETMENVMGLVSAAQLGGMGVAQLLEQMNVGIGLGVIEAARTTGMIPRMIREIRASVKGKKVDNPILSSMEVPGAEFGTAGYKMQMLLDSPSQVFDTYNHKSSGMASRLIRAAGFGNRIVSMHRAIEGAQRRAVAERLTVMMAQELRAAKVAGKSVTLGKNAKVLADMGLTKDLIVRLKPDLDKAAQFDSNGRLMSWDVTKFSDAEAGSALVMAVHRGAGQLIQEALPGEVLGIQHTQLGKILTQFRAYPLVAMEKQWGRQRAMHGAAGVLARAAAVAPFALLVHAAKVQARALGRDDADEYIEKQFTPIAIGRAVTNYMSVLGLAPDIIDGLTAFAPDSVRDILGEDKRGARGVSSAVPLVGYADNFYKGLANQDASAVIKSMPMSNVPYLVWLSNMARND